MPAHNAKSNFEQYNLSVPAGGPTPVLAMDRVDFTLNSIIIQDEAFFNGNFQASFIVSLGDVLSTLGSIKSASGTSGVGYASGAGGIVTQGTGTANFGTGVTLSKVCGSITTATPATGSQELAAGAETSFTVTNTALGSRDGIVLTIATNSSQANTRISAYVKSKVSGSFVISMTNHGASAINTGGVAMVIDFAILKAVSV